MLQEARIDAEKEGWELLPDRECSAQADLSHDVGIEVLGVTELQ